MDLGRISVFNCSTEVFFGVGAIRNIPGIIKNHKFKHALIICDPGVKAVGLLDAITREVAKENIDMTIFAEVEPNPSTVTVHKAYDLLREVQADFVIGLGGGSALDTAKAVSILGTNGGNIVDYEGANKIPKPAMPLLAIPTTAGTASEVTIFTVITDPERQYKFTIADRKSAARWALVDPELTVTLPPELTASTGMDALVHAIESYTSTLAYPVTEALALEAIRRISSNLRQAVYNGKNLQARTNMLLGSLIAGLAFNNTRLGNVHAMSHPLSARFHVPHGVANSVLLPHVMEFNRYAVPEKFARIAVEMGEVREGSLPVMAMSAEAVNAARRLSADIGIPNNFKDYHVTEDAIPDMVRDAMESGNILVNPRTTTPADLETLYKLTI